jgi:hypothetical protein
MVDCGGRTNLIEKMPSELRACLSVGSDTTLMVWADVDDDPANPDALKELFWNEARRQGVVRSSFDTVVFAFARDRLENWIEFLLGGSTDEAVEGPRIKYPRLAADAARALAKRCRSGDRSTELPDSLEWSCENWRDLLRRMS